MRTLILMLAVAGCSDPIVYDNTIVFDMELDGPGSNDVLRHRSAFLGPIKGAQLGDADEAWAGMADMACRLDTSSNLVALDIDVDPESSETLVNVGSELVVQVPGGLVITDLEGGLLEELVMPDFVDARGTRDDALVVLTNDPERGCLVTPSLGADPIEVPGAGCDGGDFWTVDPETGTIYIQTAEGILEIRPDKTTSITGAQGDMIAYDPTLQMLYTARGGRSVVQGWRSDGSLRWEAFLPGPVISLDVLGDDSAALVIAEVDSASEIWVVDGYDGDTHFLNRLSVVVQEAAVNDDGTVVALYSFARLDFFDLGYWLTR